MPIRPIIDPESLPAGWAITGPYQYAGDLRPTLRIDSATELVALVQVHEGEEELAARRAVAIVHAVADLRV